MASEWAASSKHFLVNKGVVFIMKRVFALSLLVALLSMTTTAAHAQSSGSTYTAASANESDVNAVINGPTHTAVSGDIIQIPCSGSQTVVWTSSIATSASITITALGGTPNTSASQFGSGTNCLTIRDNNPNGSLFVMTPTYSSSNNVTIIQNMNIDPYSNSTPLYNPISIQGTATSSGFPQARVDNIVFGNSVQWTESGNSSNSFQLIKPDNVTGVADHNTLPAGNGNELMTCNMSSYLGVGQYGDNSWAQPDSFGGATAWFNENNLINAGIVMTDCTEGGNSVTESGGGRVVNRFNHITASNMFQITGGHGLDTTGRPRAFRHSETYGNTVTCSNSCNDLGATFRGGTGLVWGNTGNVTGSGFYNSVFDVTVYRTVYGNNPFGYCGGLTSLDPWDTIDNNVYLSGVIASASGLTFTDSALNMVVSQLIPAGSPYSVYDTTQGFVSQIVSNTANTATVQSPISESTWSGFNTGDSYKVIRATVCMDQGGRGQGNYISGTTPTPVSPINQALDPIYEWDNAATNMSQQYILTDAGQIQINRDFYTDNWRTGNLSGPTAQTSSSVPFNGSTTCNAGGGSYTCGIGFGTLADRPTSCTQGVAYWATDQGSWNQSGSGGQGQLFKCTATNTWTVAYTPYAYPHPLVSGSKVTSSGPLPPSNLNGTVVN
jgi:hypothetical protein